MMSISQIDSDTTRFLSDYTRIQMDAKHYGDSIVLRWAPVSPSLWYEHLHSAYVVYRREVAPVAGEYKMISDSIRLMPEDELEARAAATPDHPLLVVLLQNAYRDWHNSLYDRNPATLIEKADNFNNRWAMTLFAADRDPVVADAAGFRFADPDIKPGVTYAYKVVLPGTITGVDYKVVAAEPRSFRPIIYQGFERDSSLVLQWQRRLHDPHYTAYFIERSTDSITYEPLHTLPYVQAFSDDPQFATHFYTYTDRVSTGMRYWYRLIGIDAFGDRSDPSLPVSLRAKDLTPPLPPAVDLAVDSIQKGIVITWTPADTADDAGYVVWFGLGGDHVEPVSALLSADTYSFFHQPGDYNGVATYKVAAIDSAGNAGMSSGQVIRVPDFVPPAPPVGLVAMTDSTGLIRVRWDQAEELDVIGYFVYAADGDARHFHRVTPKLYPFRQYTDTVDVYSLTEKRLYKIVAVDDALNYSDFSETLEVHRPDVIPPAPAWISGYSVRDSAVLLTLVRSSSRDVVRHELLRQGPLDSTWITIDTLWQWPDANQYVDTRVDPGTPYRYTIVAVDEAGLTSKQIQDRYIQTPIDRSTGKISFNFQEPEEGQPYIQWTSIPQVAEVELYQKAASTWHRLAQIPAKDQRFTLASYTNESLMAKLIFSDGSRSKSIIIQP